MIAGVTVDVDAEAVVVAAPTPLTVVSSAAVGGGLVRARAVVNLHVAKTFDDDVDRTLAVFVRRRAIPSPWVGLLTAAWTEKAEVAVESGGEITAVVVATVGLGNAVAAGVTPAAATAPPRSTINTIVVVDAAPDLAALVNLVATVTEVKVALVAAAGIRCPGGSLATGTSTDAVVVAATGGGPRCRFGGPVSTLGAAVAHAARRALGRGIDRWLEEHP